MALRLEDEAPNFTADTTDGELTFHDWKAGSWAVFFSHPADFTPVCTTELGRTAALQGEFAKRNTKAMALSVDPIEDHHGWAPDIGEVSGTSLNFPIVADPDRKVAELYDMIHPGAGDTSTVRSVFIIDPNNKLRLTLTYPKSVGRNFDEIVRVLDALQATDLNPIATPADWQPGERVVVSPAMSTADAQDRFQNVVEVKPYLRYADDPTAQS
ncbi:peroxiredoxin [Acidimicrobium ferrooxidans]|uniref:Peroxiredoxin n=1 Tax=Acidimicrobium ferrooxidans TaxID=53635 RepID=A0ABS3ATF5_9ACTN|nr:peroxiredoxin [Acidimicrobium ferrooxidans]